MGRTACRRRIPELLKTRARRSNSSYRPPKHWFAAAATSDWLKTLGGTAVASETSLADGLMETPIGTASAARRTRTTAVRYFSDRLLGPRVSPRGPIGERARNLENAIVVGLLEVRLVDRHRIVACRRAQLMRDSANDNLTDHLVGGGAAELRPAAARSKDRVVDPHGDRSPRPPDVGESLSERARKRACDPGRRRIAGVRPQRPHVDFYPAHRARKRESADRRAGAGKRDRAEDAERGAAHNLECGHRNLQMRAWARCAEGPRAICDVVEPVDEGLHVTAAGGSARRQPVPRPSAWLGCQPPTARNTAAPEGRNARAHEGVVASHLDRFAFRELPLPFNWSATEG